MAESSLTVKFKSKESEKHELQLIRAAFRNPFAFGELYKLYVQPVFRYLLSRVGNQAEAEDLTAQTFLAAFEAFSRFNPKHRFAPWLFTIAHHKAMDHFRQQRNLTALEEAASVGNAEDHLGGIIASEEANALSILIKALPEAEQELLRLRFLAAMSFSEMGEFLNRNEDAVKKSVYRLLARLQSQMENDDE